MNLLQIISAVQRQFGDESGAQITTSDIIRWANDAQTDIVRKTEVLQIHAETDSVGNDGSYDLPSDFIRIRRVSYDGTKIDRIELEEIDDVRGSRGRGNTSGDPVWYYVWGTRLWLYPAPDENGIGNLDIYYVKAPDELVNSADIPEIPSHMHEDIVRYCLGRAKELDEEDGKAQEVMGDYEARLNLTRDEANNPEINTYPSIRDIEGGFAYDSYHGGW